MSLCCRMGSIDFIVNQKWMNKVCKLGEVDGRIPKDLGAKKQNEAVIWIEKDGSKTRFKSWLKTSRNSCDQPLDMHHTLILLELTT